MNQGLANYLGNIDLDNRKVYKNPSTGQIQTEYSISFSPDGNTEILIPTIIDGQPHTRDEAVKHFFKTGRHLGVFNKEDVMKDNNFTNDKQFYDYVDNYANSIHERQGNKYK